MAKEKEIVEETLRNSKKFDTTALTNTHQWVTVKGVKTLDAKRKELLEKEIEVFDFIKSEIETLKYGSILPDYGRVGKEDGCDYMLYQDHFFDYTNNKNFTSTSPFYIFSEIKDTAESQARQYFSKAIASWRLDNDKKTAIIHLGKALHYSQDTCECHHATNQTGGEGTAHTRFEHYAETYKEECGIDTVSKEILEQFAEENAATFISKMAYKNSKSAHGYINLAQLRNTWDDWNTGCKIGLKLAQETTACIIRRFLKEVTTPAGSPTGKVDKGHVFIKVADEQFAGTNDYIYFGIKTKVGKPLEFVCDLVGDDFERDSVATYQFEVAGKEVRYEDIDSFYIKKVKAGVMDDQVKIERVELYIQGQRVFKVSPNKWLKNLENIIEIKK